MSHVSHILNIDEWSVELSAFPAFIYAHMWMSHVPCMNESCPIHKYERMNSRIAGIVRDGICTHTKEYVPDMNESCVPYMNIDEWSVELSAFPALIYAHMWMSHVPCMNESCPIHKYERMNNRIAGIVRGGICTHTKESCPRYQSVMCPIYEYGWMNGRIIGISRAYMCTHVNEKCFMYEWVGSHIQKWMYKQ